VGDVILKIDGREIGSPDEFEGRIADHQTGDDIKLTISGDEDGAIREVNVRVTAFPTADADALIWSLIGFAAEQDQSGMVVTKIRPNSPSANIKLKRGDRILGLGGAAVNTPAELRRKMIESRGARSVVLTVGRGPYEYNVQVPLARD